MPEIDGFEYESYEKSSSLARRDFRHAHGGPEELPAKILGKKRSNKEKRKGCPENDGGPHVYEVVGEVWHLNGPSWYRNGQEVYIHKFRMCVGCGKRKRYSGRITEDPYVIV